MADQDSNKINFPLPLSSCTTSLWDLHHHATRPTLSTSLRNNTSGSGMNLWEPHSNLSSSLCDHEDVSVSASNHSSLTIDESSHRFIATPNSSNYIIREPSTDNNIHVWSQFLLGVEGSQEMTRDGMGENLLNAKCFAGSFETSPCREYLRKLDSHQNDKWEEISVDRYPNSNTSEFFADNIDHKQSMINSNAGLYNCDHSNLIESNNINHQRSLNILSSSNNLVSSWPIAPSDQTQMSEHNVSHPCNIIPSIDENGYRPVGDNWRPREINMISQHGYSTSNIDPFSNSCSKFSSKPLLNSLSLLDEKKQHGAPSTPLMSKGNRRGQGAFINEVKKKRSDDAFQSSGSLKKPKRDNGSSNPSIVSAPAKMTTLRTPKGKVEAEKLSALQQIVSPYGKTDTASILQEAIGFIRSHQENVQMKMLSNTYMKSTGNKLQEAWGSLDRKGERNKVLDLKSKGLCLVPISSIPQEIKEDNSGVDYWPAYRGYLYR